MRISLALRHSVRAQAWLARLRVASTYGPCGDLSGPKPASNPAQFDWKSAFIQTGTQCRSAQTEPEGEKGRAQMWTRGRSYSRMWLQLSPKLLNVSTPNKHSSNTNVVHVTKGPSCRARNASAHVHRPGSNPTPTSSTAPNLLALTGGEWWSQLRVHTDADSTCFESGTEETPHSTNITVVLRRVGLCWVNESKVMRWCLKAVIENNVVSTGAKGQWPLFK